MFAERGVYQATMREITTAAGQRNSSALAYHFGSREGVLWAILAAHNRAVDAERAGYIDGGLASLSSRELVAALVLPYSAELATEDGRNYVRVVAQLTEMFPAWRDGPLSPPALRQILAELESRAGGTSASARRERVVHAVLLLTAAMAERARVPGGAGERGGEPAFLANLTDMLTGAIEAPTGPPLANQPRPRST